MEAIAVYAAEAALSAAFSAIFGKLSSQDVLKYARRNNVESEVNEWSKFLHKMKYVLDDAEERQMSEGPIKIWMDDLRNLAYDVEDILDEFSTLVLSQKVTSETEASASKVRKFIKNFRSYFSPRDIKFNVSLGSKMKEITQRFEKITKEKDDLRLTERPTERSNGAANRRLEAGSLVQESQVIGREKDKKTLVNELVSSDANGKPISVVAIVGMGGLGKTTLAQLVYNDNTIGKSFDIKAWVCVSDEFDVFKITVKITEGFTSSPCEMKDLNSVQQKLKDALHKKKFLLILDDVWNENYLQWDALSQPLAAGGLGSRVLITTRNESVATTARAVFMHNLKKLEEEECVSLLALHALKVDTFSGHPSLRELGERIAKKCDGLPLAAKALGGLLGEKPNQREWWTKVADSNMWDLPQGKCPILPALRVSYHYLPPHLKRCFAYCAIIPKDYKFRKEDLILWWMAEGFLEQSKRVRSNFMEVGNEYFEELLSRSFFQASKGYDKSKFVMHDLMNDLALWISGGICLHLDNYKESKFDIKFENLRHVSYATQRCDSAESFEKFSLSLGLRTFLALCQYDFPYVSNVILDGVIAKMRCLKLLCLSRCLIRELPDSICKLKQLRHLDMSFTQIRLLPESVCGLLNLQVLKLESCENLTQLPRDIRKLINLRLLDISDTINLRVMPPGIGCLGNLQILSKFIVGENDGLRLKELKGLQLVRGELSIWGLENVVDIQDARDANLKAKMGLVSLQFTWRELKETSALEKEQQAQILEELRPHTSLKSLKMYEYSGNCFPEWIGHSSFTNLETLNLLNCKSASLLPPLGGLMSLKMLQITGMSGVQRVGKEFLGNATKFEKTFPSLHTLILERMNALEEWCSGFASEEEASVEFPQLQKLFISDCPMLKGKLPNHLPSLAGLMIGGCPNLTNLECKHPFLKKLTIEDCGKSALKTLSNLSSLVRLELGNIRKLSYMDDVLVSMLGELQELEIGGCRKLKTLVRNGKGMEGMVGLKKLSIRNCDELEVLVDGGETGMNYFPSLESLYVNGCAKLVSFGAMRVTSSLKKMEISSCEALKRLPEEMMMDGSNSCESALEKLSIRSCPSLATFPRGRFPNQLVDLEIHGCENLENMPNFSDSMERLTIVGCNHLQSLPRIPISVVWLTIEKSMPNCSHSKNVQCQSPSRSYGEEMESGLEKMFAGCYSLEHLCISNLNWRRLPESVMFFWRMKTLEISYCDNLRELPKQMQELTLQKMTIKECPNLEALTRQNLPQEVNALTIIGCEKVMQGLFNGSLSPLASMTMSLLSINGGSCSLRVKHEAPLHLPQLSYLFLTKLGNLESLADAFRLTSVANLSIKECPKLRELPTHEILSNLEFLEIRESPLLEKRCLDRKGEYWPLLSVIPVFEIDGEDASGEDFGSLKLHLLPLDAEE